MSITVYGDIIVDEYLYGTSTRLSPEAPVPVVDFVCTETRAGGAANVYENIKSLTNDVSLSTSASEYPRKVRVFSDKHYVTRIDYAPKTSDWEHTRSKSNVIVFSDYNKGSWFNFTQTSLENADRKLIIDPKGDLSKYGRSYCIKPNKKEFEEWYGTTLTENNLESTMKAAYFDRLDTENLVITLGDKGVAHYSKETGFVHFPSEAVEVSDVTGAGDTFTAVLAYAINAGHSFHSAVKLANKASGIAVRHHGVYVIKPEDIGLKKETVVFVNGCFDVLHPGHIHLLKEARKLGSKLIVGINDDHSITRLKGPDRPVNYLAHRISMLDSLGLVDEFRVFDGNAHTLIDSIKPDVIVKGGDYEGKNVYGSEYAKIVIVPRFKEYSSTDIIERIRSGKDAT